MSDIFKQAADKSYLFIDKWQKQHQQLQVGFTMKNGGCSTPPFATFNMGLHVDDHYEDVINNRKRLAEKLQFPLSLWVSGEQTHHNEVHVVERKDKGKGSVAYDTSLKGIDGLITKEKGVLCTAFFADCVPLFFFDPVTAYLGIAHAGWRGTVGKIAEEMVKKFIELGTQIENLQVVIGPCISQKQYEVNDFVIQHIPKVLQKNAVIAKEEGSFLLDLKQLNMEILLQSGVLRHNIEVTNYCTFTDADSFFSHRRDHGQTGRMLGYIGYNDSKE